MPSHIGKCSHSNSFLRRLQSLTLFANWQLPSSINQLESTSEWMNVLFTWLNCLMICPGWVTTLPGLIMVLKTSKVGSALAKVLSPFVLLCYPVDCAFCGHTVRTVAFLCSSLLANAVSVCQLVTQWQFRVAGVFYAQLCSKAWQSKKVVMLYCSTSVFRRTWSNQIKRTANHLRWLKKRSIRMFLQENNKKKALKNVVKAATQTLTLIFNEWRQSITPFDFKTMKSI